MLFLNLDTNTNMLTLLATLFFLIFSLAASHGEVASSLDGRIVGGDVASITDYPYQASIEYLNSYRCGAAIISRTWVVSTGTCMGGLPFQEIYRVRVGTSYRGQGGQLMTVARIVRHPNYSSLTYDYNIALFQLEEPLELSRSVQIVGLPDNGNSIVEGTLARVAGWGAKTETGIFSDELRAAEVPIVSQSVCMDLLTKINVTDTMLCAGFWEGGIDACYGDAGSPLVSNSRVIGLVSWLSGCARPQNPVVYTNIGAMRDWITKETGL